MTSGKRKLRSQEWFGGNGMNAFMHRSWMKNQGLPADVFDGRPVIGICNTWSEMTPCNAHLRAVADHVKRGVYEAGGVPFEMPVMSLGESNLRPTAMLFRNLASMDVEETIRGNPMDGVILLVGCDKTTPALLMGAASCDLPAIAVSGGPMLNGNFRGQPIGSGTHVWKFYADVKAGTMPLADFMAAEQGQSRSAGSCMTMGTASTMASMVEALGIGMPDNAAIPAVDSRRNVLAHLAGRRIVELVREDVRMSHILTRQAFENAIRVNGAIGGSTNAVIHLIAIAGRLGIELTLEDWDRLGRDVPTIVDLMPSGRFLMEDFYYAGGLPAVMRALLESGRLHGDAMTVAGRTLADIVREAQNPQCGGDPAPGQPTHRPRRHRRAARQPGAQGRGHQAIGGDAGADAASRPRRGVRGYRGLSPEGRRSRAGDRRNQRHGTEELRPQGLSRHGRGGQHGPSRQAAEEGRQRHGAHFRCAHERHSLRHRRAAHGTRGCRGRHAGAGAQRRHDRAGCRAAAACIWTCPTANSSAAAATGRRRRSA